jgi:hypothetical protein
MTNAEAKTALFGKTPVEYNGVTYARVTQIIYWIDEANNVRISLTLQDKNKNSRTQARIEDVKLIYDNENQATAYLP